MITTTKELKARASGEPGTLVLLNHHESMLLIHDDNNKSPSLRLGTPTRSLSPSEPGTLVLLNVVHDNNNKSPHRPRHCPHSKDSDAGLSGWGATGRDSGDFTSTSTSTY